MTLIRKRHLYMEAREVGRLRINIPSRRLDDNLSSLAHHTKIRMKKHSNY